jgi:hypothetical protein
VLGLSPGDETVTLDILTDADLEITKFICWLFLIVRPFTFTAELESMVNACKGLIG